MKYFQLRQYRNLLPLSLLLLACIFTIVVTLTNSVLVNGEYYERVFSWSHCVGFATVASCIGFYFAWRFGFKYALIGTLLLGFFNVANFMPDATSFGLNFGDLRLAIQPFSLLLLIFCYFLNRPVANAFIRKYLLPAPTPARANQLRRESIDQFKETLARRSDDNLRQIVQERKLVGDAITAAQELLTERRVVSSKAS
ncbi:MAG: hypothetical protein EOO36_02880 [Cytophagaceae bacterium]|nr:MAG: hypothetical protein EOO36_02880 [Cytophagaceae bacterium]